jgi:hypothetical protein
LFWLIPAKTRETRVRAANNEASKDAPPPSREGEWISDMALLERYVCFG